MEKIKLIALLAIVTLTLNSCLKDTCKTSQTYLRYEAIYKTGEELRTPLEVKAPQKIVNPGKIYYYDHYLLIGELGKGIHVIDNADPAHPMPVAYWAFEGNVDIAIHGKQMYLDQFIDLVTFDISNFLQPVEVCRRNDIFPSFGFVQNKGYLVEYRYNEVKEEVDCYTNNNGNYYFEGEFLWVTADFAGKPGLNSSFSPAVVSQGSGIAGSYTRFCVLNNFLYGVTTNELIPFTLTETDCPVAQQRVQAGWNIETIFPYKNNLYIGSQNGVFIFSASNPYRPTHLSTFSHVTGCDPVVCADDLAFVTIHNGTTCGGIRNQLDILDITNPSSPFVVQSYNMAYPQGLALTAKYLYLCDDGLKIYDRTTPTNLKLMKHISGIDVTDVIALGDELAILVGADGFYQYQTTNPSAPVLLSKIEVK
ncbi:MAG: hypothetical protein IPH94_09910 [Saprospiraceae bacterium]|nr:hypothetical protein [Saprospiraceae bacterium]